MIAAGHGRRWITWLHRGQPDSRISPSGRLRWGRPNLSMLRPTKPSSAGSSVTDASIVMSTPIEMPMATPRMIDVFMSSRPSTEITTVVPAKSTARPAVSIACTTLRSGSSPAAGPRGTG